MNWLVPALLAALFFGAALVALRAESARNARRVGVYAASAALALAAGILAADALDVQTSSTVVHSVMPAGMLKVAPAATSLVALIALGLAPLSTHRQSTFVHMLWLFGVAEAFLCTREVAPLAVLWTASAYLTWRELKTWCNAVEWQRVFAWYQATSVICFAAGAVLLSQGSTSLGVGLLVVAIAIREGVLPLHSWFPRFVENAPMGLVIAFAAPQLGVYAQLQLMEHGIGPLAHQVAAVGAFTAVGAAMLGVVQTRPRRAIAYLIISQTGLVAFGLESQSAVGLTGALLNWQVLAVATSGFVMLLAALEARRGRLEMIVPNGNFAQTPRLAIAFLVLGFASVGFPLTAGFIAEDLLVQGTISEFPLLALSLIVATAFNGITVLRSFFYLFTGTRQTTGERDLSRRERWVVAVVMFALIGLGVAPWGVVSYERAPATEHHTP